MNTDVVINFQRAAADALQSMTTVLKEESSAGKSYETLLDGARSLAAGLGGMLRVSSYWAREYEIRDTHQMNSANVHRQRKSLRSLDPAVQQRSKRDAAVELLQAKNEVYNATFTLGGIGLFYIFRSRELLLGYKKAIAVVNHSVGERGE